MAWAARQADAPLSRYWMPMPPRVDLPVEAPSPCHCGAQPGLRPIVSAALRHCFEARPASARACSLEYPQSRRDAVLKLRAGLEVGSSTVSTARKRSAVPSSTNRAGPSDAFRQARMWLPRPARERL